MGFPRLLESPGIFQLKFQGPGKSLKIAVVLDSARNCAMWSCPGIMACLN